MLNKEKEKLKGFASGLLFLACLALALACLLAPFGENAFLIGFIVIFVALTSWVFYVGHKQNSIKQAFTDNQNNARSQKDFIYDIHYIEQTIALYGNLVAVSGLQEKDNTEYFKLLSYLRSKLWNCPDDGYADKSKGWFNEGQRENGCFQEHLDYLIGHTLKIGKNNYFVKTVCVLADCLNLLHVKLSQPLSKELGNAFFEIFRQYKSVLQSSRISSAQNEFALFFSQGDLSLSLQLVLQETTGKFFSNADEFRTFFENNADNYQFHRQKKDESAAIWDSRAHKLFFCDDEYINHVLSLYGNLAAISGRYDARKSFYELNASTLCQALNYKKYHQQMPDLTHFFAGIEEVGAYKSHLDYIVSRTLKQGFSYQFEKMFCYITGCLGTVSDYLHPFTKELADAIFEMLYKRAA